jgi:hypothetical protein
MAELKDLAGLKCPLHPAADITVGPSGKRALCAAGCKTEQLAIYAASLNGHLEKKSPPPKEYGGQQTADGQPQNAPKPKPAQDQEIEILHAWRDRIENLCFALLKADSEYHKGHLTVEMVVEPLTIEIAAAIRSSLFDVEHAVYKAPDRLTPIEVQEEIDPAIRRAWERFKRQARNDLIASNGKVPAQTEAALPIAWEDFGGALTANEEYLKRTAIIEKLGYTSSVMLITGGKHAGKSTLARWLAVCVAKGWPFLKREVKQGPVFYVASEDETMAARQELIRLGWTQSDPISFLAASKIGDDPEVFLGRLASVVKERGAALVVLDMLFDFVHIPDEMSYSGTREALGKIQTVASFGECLVVTTHHAPKYLETADAAVTALGSQGLAARVSPILLVRKHGPGLHSIVSTSVRDPRGEAIPESKLLRNVDGSVVLGDSWKMWMQAEVFMPRVLELLQTEPGQELTAGDVKEALGISYQLASGSLSKLYKENQIGRTGEGKKGKPFRYSADAPDSSAANAQTGNSDSSQGSTPDENVNPNDGRFGYKD